MCVLVQVFGGRLANGHHILGGGRRQGRTGAIESQSGTDTEEQILHFPN